MEPLKYLAGYPDDVQARVHQLIEQGRLGTMLFDKYRQPHAVRSDSQLYDYVQALKDRHLRKSVPLGNEVYDSKLQVMKHALGTHTAISRCMAASSRPVARSASPRCSGMRLPSS
jgi:predicted metal-dependent hydrolase